MSLYSQSPTDAIHSQITPPSLAAVQDFVENRDTVDSAASSWKRNPAVSSQKHGDNSILAPAFPCDCFIPDLDNDFNEHHKQKKMVFPLLRPRFSSGNTDSESRLRTSLFRPVEEPSEGTIAISRIKPKAIRLATHKKAPGRFT